MQYLPYFLFAFGLLIIIKGSDWFLDAVIWAAKEFHISDIIIGATLVSMCTTLPETMVSVNSALRGNTDIAFGNSLGSIAFNIGIIMSIMILFSRPPVNDRRDFQQKGILLISLLIFVLIISFIFGSITRLAGVTLLGILAWYLYNNAKQGKKGNSKRDGMQKNRKDSAAKNIILFVAGLSMTILGANLLVMNGEIIAKMLGVPDLVIGLTITAVGTSLPELVTAINSVIKKVHNISIGNILGASILNIILVLSAASTIIPIPVNNSILKFHIPFVILIATIMLSMSFISKANFRRRGGAVLLASYLVYLFLTITL